MVVIRWLAYWVAMFLIPVREGVRHARMEFDAAVLAAERKAQYDAARAYRLRNRISEPTRDDPLGQRPFGT